MTSESKVSDRRRFVRKLLSLAVMAGFAGDVLGRKSPAVKAATGEALVIGIDNYGSSRTRLFSDVSNLAAFWAQNESGSGLGAMGDPCVEATVWPLSYSKTAVYANAGADNTDQGIGVKAVTTKGFGVVGLSTGASHGGTSGFSQGVVGITENLAMPSKDNIGVHGIASAGRGVVGSSATGFGVLGISTSGSSQGVVGQTENITLPSPGTIGVQGVANNGTGVEGRAVSGTGVYGWSVTSGPGVQGVSGSGLGMKGTSATGIGIVGISQATSSLTQGVVGITENLPTPGPAGIGVQGVASTGTGVQGSASAGSGIGVLGMAWLNAACKPMVARGWAFQSANLQEWQDVFTNPLAVISPLGWLGIGTGTSGPARSVHLQANNAVFRMDRDVNSSAFILTRTALGSFGTVWKTFYVGVDASGVDNGLFFIGDRHQFVSGDSDKRLIIDNAGRVGVGRTPASNNLEVEGTASKTTAGDWLANSDVRIKTGVHDLEDPLGVIGRLHPVWFRYTKEYRRKHPSIKDHEYCNFVAQEYREVFPDSVQDDGEGLLQMDSHNVTPHLVAAVQQLKAEVELKNEQLKTELEEKTKSVEELRARLEKLEQTH